MQPYPSKGQNISLHFTTLLELSRTLWLSTVSNCGGVLSTCVCVYVLCDANLSVRSEGCDSASVPYEWLCVQLRASVCARLSVCACVSPRPHALSTLFSLQGNRCQQSCLAGFYYDEQTATCKPCHEACVTCAGEGRGQRHDGGLSLIPYLYPFTCMYLQICIFVCIHLKGHCHILTPHKRSHALAQLKTKQHIHLLLIEFKG